MHKFNKNLLYTIAVSVGSIFLFSTAHALNSGFINGLWYSSNPFFADQTVRIYTAIYNNNPFDIRGIVEFQDGDQIIGTSNFTALAGRTEEAWVDWKAPFGEHRLSAVFSKMEKLEIGKEPVPITWEGSTMADQPFIDLDTDNDGIGNRTDPDDDNDSILDVVELKNGTDPLISNTSPPTPSQITPNPANNPSSDTGTASNDTNPITQLIGGEKISALTDGIKFLQGFNAIEGALAAKVSNLLAKQQSKDQSATENTPSSTVQWQDVTSSDGWPNKIYNAILSGLLFLLQLPPLLLIIGVFIIFIFFLRLWLKWRRWRRDRY